MDSNDLQPPGDFEARRTARSPTWQGDLRTLRRLLAYMRPYRMRFFAGLGAGVAHGALSGAFPKLIEVGSSQVFESEERVPLYGVLGMAACIPLYFIVRGAFDFLSSYCLAWVGSRMLRDLRVELFAKVQRMPFDFFVRQPVSRLIQRVNNNTQAVKSTLVSLASDLVKQPVTVVVAIVVLAFIDLWFCFFALAVGIACLVPIGYFGRKVRKASSAEEQSEGGVLTVLHQTFANALVVKAYHLEGDQGRHFQKAADRQASRSLYFQKQRDIVSPLVEAVASLGMAAALAYVYMADIRVSEFLAVVAGFVMMYQPLKRMAGMYVASQRLLHRSENVFAILDAPPMTPDPPDAVELDGLHREIRFEGVHFGYSGRPEVLAGIDLVVPCNSVCAIVGPSGAGKTSLMNLLLRFYEPTRGRISIDGHDLAGVTRRSLHELIGLVTQETLLFDDTIANNIARGKRNATREEIVEAAKKAHAHDFISATRAGYDTELRGSKTLSGGQAQRIAIARAFLKDPAILVLDEATSALDSESEEQVQNAVTELMRGRTVIIVAHRLSALRRADQLVVLDRGRVVGTGRHEELIRESVLYRRLYELQLV